MHATLIVGGGPPVEPFTDRSSVLFHLPIVAVR
jgi:hypothetical protein